MRAIGVVLLLALTCAASAVGEETTCPASRAADEGFAPFEAFHEVMAPAWHVAWPARDFAALYAAGPEFSRLFKPIAMLKPAFKVSSRRTIFLENRRVFAQLVKDYAAMCLAQDSNLVYGLMPSLHEAFEATASTLLPVYYPEFEGFVITLNLILETHLPQNNMEGLVGSTETLVAKAEYLTKETIPDDLAAKSDEILGYFDKIRSLAGELKSALDDDKMDVYREQAAALQTLVKEFIASYI